MHNDWGIGITSRRPPFTSFESTPTLAAIPMSTGAADAHQLGRHDTALFPNVATRGLLLAASRFLREREDAFLLLDFVAVPAVDVLWVRGFEVLVRVDRGRGIRQP